MDKQYQIRAVYREGIETEPVDVVLETPQQLPNSDMEEWYIEEKKKSGTWPSKDKTYYTFHPYAEGNASSSWWATNNDKAQGGTYANTAGTYVGGAMVGSLFIGTYDSGIIQGHDFGSRPTSMSFWYKYKPYNSDAFKVVVSLKNGDREIATGTYESAASSEEDGEYGNATVDLNYT